MDNATDRPTDKQVLLFAADGPEGIEIFTSEDKGIVDWAPTLPGLYVRINCGMNTYAEFGPFQLGGGLVTQIKEQLKSTI